jgi:DNA-binding response OmpR family regulator
MAIDWHKFTPIESRILELLQDGHPHRVQELKCVAGDNQMEDKTIYVHVCNMRKKLRILGQDISTESALEFCQYRLIRLTASHSRG